MDKSLGLSPHGLFIVLHNSQLWFIERQTMIEQERQIVARYTRLTPSCKAGACTGQNSSMKNTALPLDEIYPTMKFHNPS